MELANIGVVARTERLHILPMLWPHAEWTPLSARVTARNFVYFHLCMFLSHTHTHTFEHSVHSSPVPLHLAHFPPFTTVFVYVYVCVVCSPSLCLCLLSSRATRQMMYKTHPTKVDSRRRRPNFYFFICSTVYRLCAVLYSLFVCRTLRTHTNLP